MSSVETPDDPDTEPPNEKEVRRAVRDWLILVAGLCVLAMIVIAFGEGN